MKSAVFFAILLIPVLAGQEQQMRIGEIEFFAASGTDVAKVRAALPLREGDTLAASDAAIGQAVRGIREAVQKSIGRAPSDVAPACCDQNGQWMIYIGLAADPSGGFRHNPTPHGTAKLPAAAIQLYQEAMNANEPAVRKHAPEDDTRGYALSSDPDLRSRQMAMREYALRHASLLREVLESAAAADQRIAAAALLGYARQSRAQIEALVRASHDPDDTVRNNAVRALGVLVESGPKAASQIPASDFIAMLNSGHWTDRNKGGMLLERLSANRDPKLLSQLRSQALASLLEMARWRSSGHSYFASVILGRIAGIEEKQLQQMITNGQVEAIFQALKTN